MVSKTSVDGHLVDNFKHNAEDQPGDYTFLNWHSDPNSTKPAYLMYVCPCGCGKIRQLQLSGEFAHIIDDPISAKWNWDGNREKPTLTPSILNWDIKKGQREQEHWHGFLKSGRFESC